MLKNLTTERLFLRNYEMNDLQNFHSLYSNSEVLNFSNNIPHEDISESKKILSVIIKNYSDNKSSVKALFLKSNKCYIGEAGVFSYNESNKRAVIGYNILPDYWGKGYATEITKELVRVLFFDNQLERIEALVMSGNNASIKVLEKNGFICEGRLRNFSFVNQEFKDVFYYGLIKSDLN